MKKYLTILLLAVIGCNDKELPVITVDLAAPEVEARGNVLIWEPVAGSSAYTAEVNGQTINLGDVCRFDLGQWGGLGLYNVRLRSEGAGNQYLSSQWSDIISVNVEKWSPVLISPDGFDEISDHPRLFITKDAESKLKEVFSRSGNEYLKRVHSYIVSFAENLISKEPVITRSWNSSMLNVGREALKRIFYTSYLYRVTGDVRYAERSRKELLSLSSFDDWNPSHYLDVAEATLACAIGLDWLYGYLSDDDKKSVVEGMYEKSLRNALNYHYYRSVNNWGPVCVGGMVCGAIAAYECYPEICRQIIERDVVENCRAMEYYGPDGGYPEGYTYWRYGTTYQTILISALESAFEYESQARYATGFMQSAYYSKFMTTPTYHVFSYADSGTDQACCAATYWFAKELNDKTLLWPVRRMIDNNMLYSIGGDYFLPLMLIWASQSEISGAYVSSGNFYFCRGEQPVFVYRSGWTSTDDTYLGVKAGYADFSHSHMDSGSFVYEKDGVRWSIDLGSQSYGKVQDMLSDTSQDGARWQLFRYGCDGHSVLRFGNGNHLIGGKAKISQTWESGDRKGCLIDMNDTFKPYAESVTRSVWCDADDYLHIKDVIKNVKSSDILTWNMLTEAKVSKVKEGVLKLTSDDREMYLECNMPCMSYALSATTGNNYDPANPGVTRIGFKVTLEAGNDYEIYVTLRPIN